MSAPVLLFAFKRARELKQTLAALQANHLASQTDLYVFVDGPRCADDVPKVRAVRALLDEVTGFRTVHRSYSDINIGCANSIIAGVTTILKRYPAVIVLEDDVVTTPNFLDFMNQGLDRFGNVPAVFSVGGYTLPFKRPNGYIPDGYFFQRTCAWGWAIWRDRWQQVDWALTDFDEFMSDPQARQRFSEGGSDRVRMLKRAKMKEIDAWDIRLCYSEFKADAYTLYPTVSKAINIGVDSPDSTTEVVYDRYQPVLDTGKQRLFFLPETVQTNASYSRQFRRKFSVPVRVWNKLLTYGMTILRVAKPA